LKVWLLLYWQWLTLAFQPTRLRHLFSPLVPPPARAGIAVLIANGIEESVRTLASLPPVIHRHHGRRIRSYHYQGPDASGRHVYSEK
jgi:hypothetical protein